MNKKRPIHWLHLSDLHFGARGEEVLHQANTEFFQGIKRLANIQATPPDIVLLSGDIAFSGKPEQYEQADVFLSTLWEVLRDVYGNCNPILLCVPGNHDLIRPTRSDVLQYDVFNRYAESTDDDPSVRLINEMLWDVKKAEILESLFSGYRGWWNRKVREASNRHDVKIHSSYIPGDICAEIHIEDAFPLCIVGMNSAWLQYNDANFEGKLSIPTRQFQAALPHSGGNPLDLFKKYERALLFMHHPPSWFSATAQNRFNSEIFVPDRFDMCLYGHMHAGRARQTAVSGGAARFEFQSPSLCGLEYYGRAREERSFGFTAGCITSEGEVRVWPFNRVSLAGGEHAFLWDQSFGDGAEHPEGVLIRPSVSPPPIQPFPQLPTSTIEGALLHIALVNLQRSEQKRFASIDYINKVVSEVAEWNSLLGRLERIDCSWDGKFTWLLSRGKEQSWNALLEQALQVVLQVASTIKEQKYKLDPHEWAPQIGIALHVEYEGHRLAYNTEHPDHRLVGEGIDYVRHMLPPTSRPYIFLSNEAYQYVRHTLFNQQMLSALLKEQTHHAQEFEQFTIETTKISIIDERNVRAGDEDSREGYNLCIRTRQGDLFLGDAHIPPHQIQFEPISKIDEQLLIDRLVSSDRVCIIGITNEYIDKCLHDALDKRNKLQRGFWEEIKIVFLAQELLDLVLDHRCKTQDLAKARQNRIDTWGHSVRAVREFFLSCGADASPHWECLQFNFLLPFEAQRFLAEGDSLIRVIPLLPNGDSRYGYQIEATASSSLHSQLSTSIDVIMRMATPIIEFNVYGHVDKLPAGTAFRLGGVVSQRRWRSFRPPEGLEPCFPVSFILLYTDIGGVRRVLLQNRTPFNTGGDFDLFSLISGKVNDEDFFFPELPTDTYQQLAYSVSNNNDDNLRIKLSKIFAEENKLSVGQIVPVEKLEEVWKNTALRELNAELGLEIKPDRLSAPYDAPFLLNRKEGFQLYIKLYILELQPEELAQIQIVRPHANLEAFTIGRMSDYKEKEHLSVFLCVHFEETILPLLRNMSVS
jgi:predicted phosphohydrolase